MKPNAASGIEVRGCGSQRRRIYLILLGVLVLDQAVKVWIKTHLALGEEIRLFDWFRIHFTENYGIAFGLKLFGRGGKVVITLLRILIAAGLLYGLHRVVCLPALRQGFKVALALIAAGALGNIIDSVFYGVIFGYDGWFHGRVVDMFFFPLAEWRWPEWLPGIGGQSYLFFQYIFNVADAALTIGVLLILFFYRKDFRRLPW